jgi:hypothetical protein
VLTPSKVLVGSTFPLSLVRRPVLITPERVETLRTLLRQQGFASFWGHEATAGIAAALLDMDIRPATPRPALRLTAENLPALDGEVFTECWVLSPEYEAGYRPQIGEEVAGEKIHGWQVLKIRWLAPESCRQLIC